MSYLFNEFDGQREPSPNEIPDAYDAKGNLTVNSWELFKQDELAREREED